MGVTTLFSVGIVIFSILVCVDRLASAIGPRVQHRPSEKNYLDWYCFFSSDQLTGTQKTEKRVLKEKNNRKQYRPHLEEQRPSIRV